MRMTSINPDKMPKEFAWEQINWNIWEHKSEKHSYIYQKNTAFDTSSYAGKLRSNVLVIDNGGPIKVTDIIEAEKLIEEHENKMKENKDA